MQGKYSGNVVALGGNSGDAIRNQRADVESQKYLCSSYPAAARAVTSSHPVMRISTVVAAALLVLPAVAYSQITPTVGIVVDSVTGRPIEGVLVSLTGGGYSQSTASHDDGTFRFSKVTPGTYTLTARRLGYARLQMPIPIEENGVRIKVSLVHLTTLDTVIALPGTGIAGQVGTLNSLRPLASADISVIGIGARFRTDSAGRFFVPLKVPGTYVVRARTPGYEPVTLSVVVPRDSTARLMLLMDTTSTQKSNAFEIAWQEFNDRARMRGSKSAIVSHSELAKTGELGLMEALQRVPSISGKQLRFGQTVCVFVDGRPASGIPLRLWDVEAVEAVEVYTADLKSETTGTLLRDSRGYECQATEISDTSPTARDRIRWLVIWAKR
jgi:hypothetical protein